MSAPHDNSKPSRPTDGSSKRADDDRLAILSTGLCLAMIALVAAHAGSRPVAASSEAIRSVVDADAAPWWELTVLPQIGPVLAGEIVRYRESMGIDMARSAAGPDEAGSRVFAQPNDLLRVRGIGPKTVERIRHDLDFGRD